MKLSFCLQTLSYALVLTLVVLLTVSISFGQVRSSSNYELQSDSINIGGGFSSSASYEQESTVGEIGTGRSDSSSYSLRAGYQQMQEVFISLASTGDVVLDALPGLTGGTSTGSTTFTVITDSPSGYQLNIAAEGNPAMQQGIYSIPDYDDGGTPDFVFTTPANQANFGFTPEGTDITQEFLDDGGTCGVSTTDTSLACWDGLSTTDRTIAEGIGPNYPAGATTTVYFRVGINSGAGVISGLYTATSTVTALPL